MDKEIRPVGKLSVIFVGHAARMTVAKLVVGQKDEGFSLLLEPVARSPGWGGSAGSWRWSFLRSQMSLRRIPDSECPP